MEEYYFLFGLALVWTVFAVVQDIRTREVSNWLNFSFIAVALAYRAFYSLGMGAGKFFVFGLIGFGIFFVLAHAFYYSRIFAGGDAKLLMGYGVILPYTSYWGLIYLSLGFVFVLFFVGAIYSLLYSVRVIFGNRELFKKEFRKKLKKAGYLVGLVFLACVLSAFFGRVLFMLALAVLGFVLLFVYLRALDKCMVKLKKPSELQEGDWLEESVKVGRKTIKKSVHGLSLAEIGMLEKVGRRVLIKEGVPFTPAFLMTLVIMGYAFLFLGVAEGFWVFLF